MKTKKPKAKSLRSQLRDSEAENESLRNDNECLRDDNKELRRDLGEGTARFEKLLNFLDFLDANARNK